MNELQEFTLRLSLTKKLGPKVLKILLDKYLTIDKLFLAYKNNKLEKLNIANLDISSVYKDLQRRNIKYICFWEDDYPLLLRECEDFPLIIFYVGNPELLLQSNLLSIVGTRTITNYGKCILDNLIPQLHNNTVVSGMAYGVDDYAHNLAVQHNIKTIAVLPFSCDDPTPKGNSSLYRNILNKDNLVISEFPPSKLTHNGLFPRRNRIIAGLSKKTIVIEAGLKSGALITADLAFNYNREVYAFPGNINSLMSSGCNYLIKNNIAQLITDSSDLGLASSGNIAEIGNMTDIEREIYCAILLEPKSINEISNILKLDINLVSGICTNFEISGILNTDDQNKYHVS